MKSETYSLEMPPRLLAEVRKAAKATGLSVANAMRQSIKLGLPKLREQLGEAEALKPFTTAESPQAFGSDPEWDALEAVMARMPISIEEE